MKQGVFRLLAAPIRSVMQKRNYQSVVCGPPIEPITLAELLLLGSGMILGMIAFPAYSMFTLQDLKKGGS